MSDQIVLAKGYTHDMDCLKTGLNNNVLVIGGTGSGKSMSFCVPFLTHVNDTNLIITVTKERIMHQFKPALEQRGYKSYVLNLARPDMSNCSFDPLQYITSLEDVDYLADAIIMANPKKVGSSIDPYWDSQAVNLLKALLLLTLTVCDDPNLDDLIRVIRLMHTPRVDGYVGESINWLYDEIRKKDLDHPGLNYWNTFYSISADKTMGTILGIVCESVNAMFSPSIIAASRKKTLLDFEQFAQEKSCLFIVTSPVNASQHTFCNMLYSQSFKTLFEFAERQKDGRLPYPIHMIADDFATGGKVPSFDEYISIFREKGISVSLLCQSRSQLESLYGERAATTIINGCDTYLYLGGMDLSTCREISIRTDRPMKDVLSLPVGKLYLMQRGKKAVFADRYPILEDPEYQNIVSKEKEYENKHQKTAFD